MDSLKKSPVFQGLSFDEIERLVSKLEKRKIKKNELIIKQGQRGLNAYLLTKGKVEVFYLSKDGEKTTIIYHEAPFIFGEVELWEEHPYLANVAALEICEIIEIPKRDYLRILHSNHQVCINLIKLLSNLLWQTGEDRRVRFFGRVEHLLANLICYYANLYGEKRNGGIVIKNDVNKSKLADALGVARQSVIRAFKEIEKEGLVKTEEKQIFIPDIGRLTNKARNL